MTMQVVTEKIIKTYVTQNGEEPFSNWLASLDSKVRHKVKERLWRVMLGNLGDYKFVGEGVFELRLNFGAGYRIYFGNKENAIILLLCGGDKSTQYKDIARAITYWKEYLSR